MNQIFPDVGLVALLSRMAAPSVHYHLFTNNIIPDLSTNLGALVEAAFGGYVVVTVLPGAFTTGSVVANQGSIIASPIAFFNTSGVGQDVYGYFVTDSSFAVLLAVARFDGAPITIPDGGNQQVVPLMGDFSKFSS